MSSERDLVLGYPDLAARLTRQPLDFKTAEQWNGYIPPYMTPSYDRHVRNDSPQRVHLVAIVREAIARKYGPDSGRAWLERTNADRWSGPWTPCAAVDQNRPTDIRED